MLAFCDMPAPAVAQVAWAVMHRYGQFVINCRALASQSHSAVQHVPSLVLWDSQFERHSRCPT